jgi:hypothetical protein
MVDEELMQRVVKEKETMKKVFEGLKLSEESKKATEFFDMASNYYKDSLFFFEKKDYVRAFEAITISWSYIDAGVKMGFFSVPRELAEHFTS